MAIEQNRRIRQFSGGFKLRTLDVTTTPPTPTSGFIPVGGTTEFSIQTVFETTDVPGYDVDTYGKNLAVISLPKPSKVALKGNTLADNMLAFALAAKLGEKVVGAGGTVTTEAHTAWNGQQIVLAHRDVSNLVLTTPTKGTGTLYTSTAAGFPVGTKVIPLITGTGTVLAGDTVTFAGDTTKYTVEIGITAPGSITLKGLGLRQAIPAATTAMTIVSGRTLVLNTDYEINPAPHTHWVEIKEGVIGLDGAPLNAAYTYGAINSITWTPGELPVICEFIGEVQDRISGNYGQLRFAKLQLSSSAVIDFVTSKDVANVEFECFPFVDENGKEFTFTEYST